MAGRRRWRRELLWLPVEIAVVALAAVAIRPVWHRLDPHSAGVAAVRTVAQLAESDCSGVRDLAHVQTTTVAAVLHDARAAQPMERSGVLTVGDATQDPAPTLEPIRDVLAASGPLIASDLAGRSASSLVVVCERRDSSVHLVVHGPAPERLSIESLDVF